MPPSPAVLQYARTAGEAPCLLTFSTTEDRLFSAGFWVLFLESAQNALLSVCPSYLSGDLCTSFIFPLSIPP